MADTKISALPAASALTGTEEFAANQGGASKKVTATQVGAFAADAIDGTTLTDVTITGASDFNAGPTGTSRVSIRADYGPLDDPGIVFEIAGDASDLPPFISGGFATGIGNFVTVSAGSFDRTTEPVPSYTVTRDTLSGVGLHQFLDAAVRIGADGLEVQGPLTADTVDIIGSIGTGSVGTGTFRDSVDARVTAVAPTVTMTTGGVGTGAFRDAVDARANAMLAARMQAGTASSGTVVAATAKVVTVTFPTAFSSAPKVTLTGISSDPGVDRRVSVVPGSETTTQFQVAFWRSTGTASFDTNWLAVKP